MKMKVMLPGMLMVGALLITATAAWAGADQDVQADEDRGGEAVTAVADASLTFPLTFRPLAGDFALASGSGLLYACFPPGTPGDLCGGGCAGSQSCGIQVSQPSPGKYCIQSGAQCVPHCSISVNQARFCGPGFSLTGGGPLLVAEGCKTPDAEPVDTAS